ncbi:hypothetical protein GW17_00020061 [Ensete ventricosum]|nr:hypothetical protein GW17_00020061 [Ensete ventricosum]
MIRENSLHLAFLTGDFGVWGWIFRSTVMKLGNDPWRLFFVGCWWNIFTLPGQDSPYERFYGRMSFCFQLAPCNPAVGGPAKSQLVHEVDALGGEIGKIADR